MPVRSKRPSNDPPLVQLMLAQDWNCFYCGQPFSRRRGPTRDHLFPRSMGCSLPGNKVAAHSRCNVQKGDRMPTPEEYERASALYAALGMRLAYRMEPVGYRVVFDVAPALGAAHGSGQ